MLQASSTAAAETVQVAVAGYQEVSAYQRALFNLFASFLISFGSARGLAHLLRRQRRVGPFRDVMLGDHHIHHFVPGIALTFASGTAAFLIRSETARARLAPRLRRRDGHDPRRVGAAARAGGRLLDGGGGAEPADHPHRASRCSARWRSRCGWRAAARRSCWWKVRPRPLRRAPAGRRARPRSRSSDRGRVRRPPAPQARSGTPRCTRGSRAPPGAGRPGCERR